MSNILKYKDYIGTVEYSTEDAILFGKVIGVDDLISYQGTSVKELRTSFEDAVDDYLEICLEVGKEPNKIYRGIFNVRTSRENHRALAISATKRGMKLNELVNKAFEYLIKHEDEVLEA